MLLREYINNPQDLLNEGKKLIQLSDDRVFAYRVTLVNLLLANNGMTTAALSELSGVPVRTLNDWVKKADETHFEALRPKTHPGKTARLTDEQYAEIKEALLRNPEEYGYQVWDGKSLSDFIQKTYEVTLGVRQCQRIFHKLGFSRIRPQTFPALGDENSDEREEFKKNARYREQRESCPCFPGRSAFSADRIGNIPVGFDWKSSKGQVRSGTKEHCVQWLCHSLNWRPVGEQTRMV